MNWKDAERKFLKTLEDEKRSWVEKTVNLDADNELTEKTRAQLIRMFPGKPKAIEGKKYKTLNDKEMILTFVWQVAMKIRAGVYTKIKGNMRTAWYKYLEQIYVGNDLLASDVGEPVDAVELLMPAVFQNLLMMEPQIFDGAAGELRKALSGHPKTLRKMSRAVRKAYELVQHAARERYVINTMTGSFDEFIRQGIFRFGDDFGFMDPGDRYRIIGQKRPRVIFFTEKEGLWWLCEELAKDHGITVFSSQGETSLLAVEFLVGLLKKEDVKSLVVGALTDYDPWGYEIAGNICVKLAYDIYYGLEYRKDGTKKDNVHLTRLNGTQEDLNKLFTPEQIQKGKRDLRTYSQYKQDQVKDWMEKTEGIDGEPYGIHVDLARPDRLRAVADEWIQSV